MDASMSTNNPAANTLQLLAIPQLMKKHFFIPDYQRGYRWEQDQIYQLLKDLWKYFKLGKKRPMGFYCLQPIVVKECSKETIQKYALPDLSAIPAYDDNDEKTGPKNNVWYEVIDGQQRLTTIRILLAFHEKRNFIKCHPYELKYATRPEFGEVFDNLDINLDEQTAGIKSDFVFKNVDVEYVQNCARHIITWFTTDTIVEKYKFNEMGTFLADFYKDASKEISVQVIWYESKETTDSREIFERLNNLKVPLSSSELIRALFLSETAEYGGILTPQQLALDDTRQAEIRDEDKKKKQGSINAKWDEIEHFFQNDKFWAFVTNRDSKQYRNRIELLFDFMSGKYVKSEAAQKDRLFTYLYFDSQDKDLWDLWEDVVRNFDCLRFWFENKDYYHKIGYLIHEKQDAVLISLLSFANSLKHKKSEFEAELDEQIRKTINTSKTFFQLSYDDARDYKVLKSVLLLYNIELTRSLPNESWFPFDEYKDVEKKDGWTLEHIHAQNSECLDRTKRAEWRDWVAYTIAARESILSPDTKVLALLSDLKAMKVRLDEEIKNKTARIPYEDVVDLFKRDLDCWSGGKAYTVMHQLSNLALLSQGVNSGISKGAFSVKQQYINKCIADGVYIPIATKKVFLKHYYHLENSNSPAAEDQTKAELLSQQFLTWDDSDRAAYLDSIFKTLSHYFSPDKF